MTDTPRDRSPRWADDLLDRVLQGRRDHDDFQRKRAGVNFTGAPYSTDPEITSYLLRQATSDPIIEQSLRRIAYEQDYGRPMNGLTTADLADQLGKWLAEGVPGLVDLEQREYPVSARGIDAVIDQGEAETPPGTVVEQELDWIEIRLVDAENNPMGGVKYRVTLSSGTIEEGELDQDGLARFDRIPTGDCTVTFPELGDKFWGPTP